MLDVARSAPIAIEDSAMTWIKTVRMDEDDRVKQAMEAQRKIYPIEYATPVASVDSEGDAAGITASHTLIPDSSLLSGLILMSCSVTMRGSAAMPLTNSPNW